ncbi:MAG: hypothetical protein HY763_07530 [Planctomycetes bacterium]|nr:hypothetical protein [Planctomycetota bacterium]
MNEAISFVLAVSPEATLPRPALRFGALESPTGQIDSSCAEIFRVHAVTVPYWPGWHLRSVPPWLRNPHPLDVLVPLRAPRGGMPPRLEADRMYHFWVDVSVPKGLTAGTFRGKVELLSDDRRAGEVDVELVVLPFVLPDSSPTAMIAELDHRRLMEHHTAAGGGTGGIDDWPYASGAEELEALVAWTVRLFHEHRVSAVLPALTPRMAVGPGGRPVVDWSAFDEFVEPVISGRAFADRVACGAWPLPLGPAYATAVGGRGGLRDDRAESYARECLEHFAAKGWLERSYALPADSGGKGHDPNAAADSLRELCHWLAPGDHRLALSSLPPERDGSAPVAMARERSAGLRTWLRMDRPPFCGTTAIQGATADVRVLAWVAEALQAGAVYLGAVNEWPGTEAGGDPDACVRQAPHTLLYPGGPYGLDRPVASVRLKELRRSQQDGAYVRLLREHGLGHIADALVRAVVPHAGAQAHRTHPADGRPSSWPADHAVFEAARRIMADALTARVRGRETGSDADLLERNLTWRRFMQRTQRVGLTVDGVRVRAAPDPWGSRFDAEVAVTVENGTRLPIETSVLIEDLPPEWGADSEVESELDLPPGSVHRLRLTAHYMQLPLDAAGIWRMPVAAYAGPDRLAAAVARSALVTAAPAPSRVRVDGDLSDWPAAGGNVADDFLLVAGSTDDGSSPALPRRRTVAFVLCDREALYVALRVEADTPRLVGAVQRKRVRYEDMVPVGEELVELLFDPLNARTRSPEDLYHFVVKPGGADWTGRGVPCDPPCGEVRPWAVDIDVATRVEADHWTAEVRIPFSAFEAEARQTVWGFNVTRFDRENEEFSTWSGASPNPYDPISLGNLRLP